MSEHTATRGPKILHSPMTNRWYIALAFRKDGSAREKIDITDTLDLILRPASERIDALLEQRDQLLTIAKRYVAYCNLAGIQPLLDSMNPAEDLLARARAAIQRTEGEASK